MFISVQFFVLKELKPLRFALDINKNMKNLGIKSLNIISNQDAMIDSSKFRTIKIYLKETTNGTVPLVGSVGSVGSISSINLLATKLTTPAIETARNLHKLL